jgi:predicted O-methyltransferase YrrM
MSQPVTAPAEPASFDAVLASVAHVEGWMTPAQARWLWDRAQALRSPATIVEIGSYRGRSAIILANAAAPGVEVVAIDPHGGNDRGPQQIKAVPEEGQRDHETFLANLAAAGVDDQVRHVRAPSQDALDDVDGAVDLLYIDGAHRYGPARDDIRRWGDRVAEGGTMLIHDSFSSVGVTLAIITSLFFSRRFRYLGRTTSMTAYRREAVPAGALWRNALHQVAELPWFLRNVVVKALILANLRSVARLLGHRDQVWPH